MNSTRVRRIAKIDYEVSRRSADNQAAAGRISGGDSKTNQFSVGEGILLGLAANGHTPVRPRGDMLDGDRGTIVVIASVAEHDARVRLPWQWADYVRERIVRQPAQAVVV